MSMQKAVIASDLPAIRELVSDQVTGVLFEAGNSEALADKALKLLDDSSLRDRLGVQSRAWVLRERSWDMSVAKYNSIYTKLVGGDPRCHN
jgi:glycosyltransferase involved in cell wall biosynthesis